MANKVLVGCPTSYHKEYCLDKYATSVKALTYSNYDVLLVDNSKNNVYLNKIKSFGLNTIKGPYFEGARDRIIASRNMLRDKVLNNGYDYFLSLEQDVIPPKDIIERLLSHGKNIITAIYFTYNTRNNVTKLVPVLYDVSAKGKDFLRTFKPGEIEPPRLLRVRAAGLGCILIHKRVLEKVKFRFNKQYDVFDDIHFCNDAVSNNFEIYADTSIRCKHLIKGWNWLDIKEKI